MPALGELSVLEAERAPNPARSKCVKSKEGFLEEVSS